MAGNHELSLWQDDIAQREGTLKLMRIILKIWLAHYFNSKRSENRLRFAFWMSTNEEMRVFWPTLLGFLSSGSWSKKSWRTFLFHYVILPYLKQQACSPAGRIQINASARRTRVNRTKEERQNCGSHYTHRGKRRVNTRKIKPSSKKSLVGCFNKFCSQTFCSITCIFPRKLSENRLFNYQITRIIWNSPSLFRCILFCQFDA